MTREHLLRWLRPLSQVSFARQLGVAGVVAVLAMGLSSALVSSWQGSRQVRATLEQQGLGLANGLAQQSQLALLTASGENAREAIGRAFSYPDILRVEVLNADGTVLVAQGAASTLAITLPAQAASAPYLESETRSAWSFVAPVRTSTADASPFETQAPAAEFLGYVRVTQGKATLEQLQRRLVLIVFSVGLGFSLLVLWGFRVLARNLMRPLGALSDVMARAGAGAHALHLRAPVSGPRDIARMAQVFNDMMQSIEEREQELQHKNAELARHAAELEERVTERTQSLQSANAELQGALQTLQAAQKQLVENEKLVSLGRLVAGVAHELNTPLGNALVCASTLEDQQRAMAEMVHTGQVRKSTLLEQLGSGIEASSLVRRNVERAADIVHSFKQLALDQTTEMRRVFLADQVISDVLKSLRPMFKHTAFDIQSTLAPDLEMDSYPGPLGQVITNVVQNALLHGFEGRSEGVLRVACHAAENGMVRVVCSDDGNGMTPQVLERIFDAFFTTKFGQGGSGLGMQIVYTLVTGLLGGQVHVTSAPGQGCEVEIILPLHAPAAKH
jgi:signal transduction histidine kinase